MRLPEEPEVPLSINLIPMIDVIFAILTFFIVSSLFLTKSESLPVNLPGAVTAQSQETAQITVTIAENGSMALNRQPIKLEDLQTKINTLIQPNSATLVLVNADENVAHGKVIKVMDQLRQIPGLKMAIAVNKEGE
jgi:biopolymer transport protein ExbD